MLHKNEEAGPTIPFDLGQFFSEEAPLDTEPESGEGDWFFLALQHTRAGDLQAYVLYLPNSKGPKTI